MGKLHEVFKTGEGYINTDMKENMDDIDILKEEMIKSTNKQCRNL